MPKASEDGAAIRTDTGNMGGEISDDSDIPEGHAHGDTLRRVPVEFRRYLLELEEKIDGLRLKIHGPNG